MNTETIDFAEHNAEVKHVWDAYNLGNPIRVPMTLGMGPRILLMNPKLNTEGITWEEFSNDPELMFQTWLKYKYYVHHNIPHDIEMGIPSQWDIYVEFVNIFEAAWFGCDIYYPEGQCTAAKPRYTGDRRNEIFDRGIPSPFDGFMARVREYYEYFVDRAKNIEFHNRPVYVYPPSPLNTHGPLTIAVDLRGSEIFTDMLIDEDYYHKLMSFITEAVIARILAWREYLGIDLRPQVGAWTDDAIQMISVDTFKTHVLPYHRRLIEALWGEGPHSLHLCGNVQRHLPMLIHELNVKTFDTGFPISFSTLREEVGDDVTIYGGVRVSTLLNGNPEDVQNEARDILMSGIMRGGKFIMKEANNLPPCVPIENISAMYSAVKEYGKY